MLLVGEESERKVDAIIAMTNIRSKKVIAALKATYVKSKEGDDQDAKVFAISIVSVSNLEKAVKRCNEQSCLAAIAMEEDLTKYLNSIGKSK